MGALLNFINVLFMDITYNIASDKIVKRLWQLVPSLLFLIIFLFKYETFTIPGFWDELAVYINSGVYFSKHSFLNILPGLHPIRICYGHPPFIFFSLASLYRIFGYSNAITHIYSVFIGFLGVLGTYLLGRRLHDRRTGLIAALLLFFSPIYYAQTGMVSGETFVATFGVLCIYFFMTDNWLGYLVVGLFLAMSKATCLVIFFAIVLYEMLFERKRPDFWKRIGFHALPMLLLLLFLATQYLITGKAVDNPDLQESIFWYDSSWDWIYSQIVSLSKVIFFEQWRYVVSAFILVYLVQHYRRFFKRENMLLLLIIAGYFCAFLRVYFLPRYILPVFPFFFILSAQAITHFEPNKSITTLVIASLCSLFLWESYRTPTDCEHGIEINMTYADYVKANVEVVHYLEENYSDKNIFFCLTGYTLDPDSGYTTHTFAHNNTFQGLIETKDAQIDRNDYDVLVTPFNKVCPGWTCKNVVMNAGYYFDRLFTRGPISFYVYVKKGVHKFK
jgi:hypothetical protein